MKRSSRLPSVVVGSAVACLALALLASCADDSWSSSTTSPSTSAAATTVAATTVATTSGAPLEGACADREALRASVAALADVDIRAEGTNGLTAAVDVVKSDLEKVRASAGSIVGPQVQAVQDALAALEAGISNLGSGGAAAVAAALPVLSTATTTLLTSLEGGPCG